MSDAYRSGQIARKTVGDIVCADSKAKAEWEPELDGSEIQGNILAGFNKDHQSLLFFQLSDRESARRWFRRLSSRISSLDQVFAFNNLYKSMQSRTGAVQATWLSLALSYRGLKKLTNDADLFCDSAFKDGMCRRSVLLGDSADITNPSNCNNWLIGGPNNEPDILAIIASDSSDRLKEEADYVLSSTSKGIGLIFAQQGQVRSATFSSFEHFGYRDAISQPGIRGKVSGTLLTPRQPDNFDRGEHARDLIWPGQFVFGYPGQDPNNPNKPGRVVEAGPLWAKNGSFLVFRRLRQDVEKFWTFLQSTGSNLGLPAEFLAAKLMGRWRNGTPLIHASNPLDPTLAIDNDFTYQTDPVGLICPFSAHIRKANPRNDAAPSVQTHRILRRGIPFGQSYPAPGERGLLFMSYQTSIEHQFEFIVRNWLLNPNFKGEDAGTDAIIGQGRRFLDIAGSSSGDTFQRKRIAITDSWVTATGGGYFFVPSVTTLRSFGD